MVCGALIRSHKIFECDDEWIAKCVEFLLKSARLKKFQHSLAFTFLSEMVKQLKKSQIKHLIWAQMENELAVPLSKHNRDSIFFCLTLQEAHSSISNKLFASTFIGNEGVLSQSNANNLIEILWSGTSLMTINHPVYEIFSRSLANSTNLLKFWSKIDKHLVNVTKINEIITIRVLNGILKCSTRKPEEIAPILSNNLIQMIINRYSNLKQKNGEIFIEFYKEMFSNMTNYLKKAIELGYGCLSFIKKLILHPGQLNFDRTTSTDLIYSTIMLFNVDELKEFVDLLKSIIVGELEKGNGEKWLNAEKLFAAQTIAKLMMHKLIVNDVEWKQELLIFLFKLGFCKTTNGDQLTTKADKDIGSNIFKPVFNRGLDSKHQSTTAERDILINLIKNIDEMLNSKHSMQYLKTPLSDDGFKAWKEMYEIVNRAGSKKTSKRNIELVINIILLHMGLQLFNEEALAISAIDELKSCIERVSSKKSEDEPDWIEVVTDLILHLLSYNSGLLRNVVVKVFASLCSLLTISSIHQILSVLDMTEGYNPLTDVAQEEDSDSDNDNNESESEDDENDNTDSDEEVESEDNSLMDDEGTVTSQLRLAVTNALGTAGADTDVESVDLDDMDENEAKRLDDALSQAFKQYAEKRRSKKPTKKERIALTSATHFRVRVLDLIDIYIKTEPKLSFLLEILIVLLDLLNNSAKDGGPVFQRTQQLLNKLTNVKVNDNVDDVTDAQIIEIFKQIISKKFTVVALSKRNEFLPKCCNFLIINSEIISKSTSQDSSLIDILKENLSEFINNRNSTMPLNVFSSLFQLQYDGIWSLCKILTKELNNKIRSMRCSQILGLLKSIYKNHRFLLNDIDQSKQKLNKIENKIVTFITKQSNETTITQKVFGELLETLITMHKTHRFLKAFAPQYDFKSIIDQIQLIRQNLNLDSSKNIYKKFCNQNNLEILENKVQANGTQSDSESDVENNDNIDESEKINSEDSKKGSKAEGKKRKKIAKNKIRAKKMKKELRLKASSDGMHNELEFSKYANINGNESTEIVSPKKKKKN